MLQGVFDGDIFYSIGEDIEFCGNFIGIYSQVGVGLEYGLGYFIVVLVCELRRLGDLEILERFKVFYFYLKGQDWVVVFFFWLKQFFGYQIGFRWVLVLFSFFFGVFRSLGLCGLQDGRGVQFMFLGLVIFWLDVVR